LDKSDSTKLVVLPAPLRMYQRKCRPPEGGTQAITLGSESVPSKNLELLPG